jgi:hypothetical protein
VNSAAGRDGILNKAVESCRRSICYLSKTDSANPRTVFLNGNHHQCLIDTSATLHQGFWAADVAFINLNSAAKMVAARANHGPAQFVHPGPSRFVAPQPENPLQTQSTGTIFLRGYAPHCAKPDW